MNILVVHETEYIEKAIFEYQIIPEILSTRGHNVYVIDFPTNWATTKSNSLLAKSTAYSEIGRANKTRGITLLRPTFIRIPVLSRVSAFIAYFFLIDRAIQEHKIDRIILFAAPTNGLQTILLARKHGIPVLFRSLDVLHQIVPHKILEFPTILMEKFVYTHADKISAITPKLVDYTVQNGAKPENCSYLPTGADADIFFYQPKDEQLLSKHGLVADDLILLFSGTLYNFSGLSSLINALPGYLNEFPNLKLLIVGGGEQYEELQQLVRKLGLNKHVILAGFVNYHEVPRYINLANICINPFEINEITNIIFPSKIYQYLACEKPVIATRLKGMLDIFPPDRPDNGIFYFNSVSEFFDIVRQIKDIHIKPSSPTLQEITSVLEQELLCMESKKSQKEA